MAKRACSICTETMMSVFRYRRELPTCPYYPFQTRRFCTTRHLVGWRLWWYIDPGTAGRSCLKGPVRRPDPDSKLGKLKDAVVGVVCLFAACNHVWLERRPCLAVQCSLVIVHELRRTRIDLHRHCYSHKAVLAVWQTSMRKDSQQREKKAKRQGFFSMSAVKLLETETLMTRISEATYSLTLSDFKVFVGHSHKCLDKCRNRQALWRSYHGQCSKKKKKLAQYFHQRIAVAPWI